MSRVAEPRSAGTPEPLRVVEEHIRAFNACDLDAVMAGFDNEAVFSTSDHLVVGARAISRLFADSFAMPASARLHVQQAVSQGDTVACELNEQITTDGVEHSIDVAAFFTVRGGRLARVRIYRDLAGN